MPPPPLRWPPMIAERRDDGAEEEREDQAGPAAIRTPPSAINAPTPQNHGGGLSLGRRLLGSIHAIAGVGASSPSGPKVGLGLLLHLNRTDASEGQAARDRRPQVQEEESTFTVAETGAAVNAKGLQLVLDQHIGVQCKLSDEDTGAAEEKLGPVRNALKVQDWVNCGVVDGCLASVNDGAVEDQEVAGWQKGKQAATLDAVTMEDHQCTSENSKASMHENAVESKEKLVEQVGTLGKEGTIRDGNSVDMAAPEGVVVPVSVNGADEGAVKKEKVKVCIRYPQRPGMPNCVFYMSKGSCSYGISCRYNHPQLKANSDVSSLPPEQGSHGVAENLKLNRIGLPIREGARNCTYYMRNGACRYGTKCHFDHPERVKDAQFYLPTGCEDNALPSSRQLQKFSSHATFDDTSYLKRCYDHATLDDTSYPKSSDHATFDDTSYSKKSSDHATLDDTSSSSEVLPSNILRMLLPPQKIPPDTERKVKKNSNWSSASDDSDGCCSADSSDGPLCKQEHMHYPERPGRPECPFYMRFGDCKFAEACNYHHPKDRFHSRYHPKDPSLGEELRKYPERPGEPECPFYMKSRFCKFGEQCKFHHPKYLTPSRHTSADTKKTAETKSRPATRITLKDHECQQQQYPERPGQPDCRYYMQFGKCYHLSACIFHHPKERLPTECHPLDPSHSDNLCQQALMVPEIYDLPECPFYLKAGRCQFGSACEFRHPKDRCSTTEEAIDHGTGLVYDDFTRPENVLQQQEHTLFPEKPGEPECFFYMRHGVCKYQMNCKYHHPADRFAKKQDDSTNQ